MHLSAQALHALSEIPGTTVRRNEPLAPHTRFQLGGPALALVDGHSAEHFPDLYRAVHACGVPVITLGGGSNLIVSDAGFDGIVLRFRGAALARHGDITSVESGIVWQHLVDFHVAAGLAGMEKMTGIPGWLGGALYGNAGAYGQTIMDFTESVTIFDGHSTRQIPNADCHFAYRTSGFKAHKDWVILSAHLRLLPGDAAAISEESAAILATRNEKFPPTMRCAGSIFKNLHVADLPEHARQLIPPGAIRAGKVASAWFLEQVGAKGSTLGGIRVADYHANLIYNDGQGTAQQVCDLIDDLKARVQVEFGFALEEEVQYVGFPNRASR
jgi:UDP-N-acetylmuramate dehydrogenase